MLYIYSERLTPTVVGLLTGLNASRIRRFDGMDFWERGHRVVFGPKDAIVCWDKYSNIPEMEDVRVLNAQEDIRTPVVAIQAMVKGGVTCIEKYASDKSANFRQYIEAGYFPRRDKGEDLLNPELLMSQVEAPDYYTRIINFHSEYRIHSFNAKSIRAGECVPRDGFRKLAAYEVWKPNSDLAHFTVKTYEGGWTVRYKGFVATPALRGIAHRAVKSLGLTFGCVSIGQVLPENLYVIDVKQTPELQGETLAAYVKAISQWYEGNDKEGE